MLQKTESNKISNSSSNSGNSNPGQLLRDIEEISRALYLHKPPAKALLPPPYDNNNNTRSKSVGKAQFSGSNSNPNPNPNPALLGREDLSFKDKKPSSVWNWKKPLKALSHVGNRKFNCCFYLHVHSLDGLPVSFNGLTLSVVWKRKDEVLKTSPSRVEEGVAEFHETLMHRCSVYGSRNGANHLVKYEEKLSLIYVSVNGAPGLEMGKHWVDLTRVLPLSFEELEGEKSFGKWSTSFNLSGKAKGANLNVSLGYLVTQDKAAANLSGNPNVPQVIETLPKRACSLDTGARTLRRVGSVPGNVNPRFGFSLQSHDLKGSQDVMLTGGLELSNSISLLCQRLDEGNLCRIMESDSEDVVPVKSQDLVSVKGIKEYEDDDDVEFTIVEVGTEIPEKEQSRSDGVLGDANDESAIENIYVDDVNEDCDIVMDEKTMIVQEEVFDNILDDFMVNEIRCEKEDSICTEEPNKKEVESASHIQLVPYPAESNHPFVPEECLKERSHIDLNSAYTVSKSTKRSLSFDNVTESVSNEFLNMLEMDGCRSSDSDPRSPREQLLREFEKEGDLLLFDWNDEHPEIEPSASPGSDFEDYFEDSDLSMIIQAAEEESKRESELLKRRNAKILEGLETEALMREWGLNEKDFQNSPHILSGGFGSPIDTPLEEPLLPAFEVGFGPSVRIKGGGFLRSMNPSLFRNAKNGGNLVIQMSAPVVIPRKMGGDVLEILQHMAAVGIDRLHMQLSKLMPLENVTGKTIHQVAQETAPTTVVSDRFEQLLSDENKDEGFPSSWNCNDLISEVVRNEMGSDYVSLECLVPLAINKIEALSLEGLRIQSYMSGSEAPSIIYPQSYNEIDDLMDLSLSLEEWLRLDARNIGDEEQGREQLILIAHDAKCTGLVGERLTEDRNSSDISDGNRALFGNNLTIAAMVRLRDPFRNYEPVGVPMLALIQVERGLAHSMPKVSSMVLNENEDPILEEVGDNKIEETIEGAEEGSPKFKIVEVHLAGVDTEPGNRTVWGTTTELQSGSRWLLAAGLGKTTIFALSNSKAIVRVSPLVSATLQHKESLWSISSTSHVHDMRPAWKDMIAPHIRNPNVIFE